MNKSHSFKVVPTVLPKTWKRYIHRDKTGDNIGLQMLIQGFRHVEFEKRKFPEGNKRFFDLVQIWELIFVIFILTKSLNRKIDQTFERQEQSFNKFKFLRSDITSINTGLSKYNLKELNKLLHIFCLIIKKWYDTQNFFFKQGKCKTKKKIRLKITTHSNNYYYFNKFMSPFICYFRVDSVVLC